MADDDPIPLSEGDFRSRRSYLNPSVFFWENGQPDVWVAPTDLIDQPAWDHIMNLATHVALETTDHDGSRISRLNDLHSGFLFASPYEEQAPLAAYPSLLASEELDALTFNAVHGYYRQAISCLRVALEVMTIAAGFAVDGDQTGFQNWQKGHAEGKFGVGRVRIRNSAAGRAIDSAVAPHSIFGDSNDAWLVSEHARLCDYAHSRAGHDNGGFWESNGPLYVARGLAKVEEEVRETLALCYLLVRLSWPTYAPSDGQRQLLDGPQGRWAPFVPFLRRWLLSPSRPLT